MCSKRDEIIAMEKKIMTVETESKVTDKEKL